ncbi:MAG: hypothetical protein ACI9V1_003624 [Spirosomataceae bacterium]|jgi:hypothetical protein
MSVLCNIFLFVLIQRNKNQGCIHFLTQNGRQNPKFYKLATLKQHKVLTDFIVHFTKMDKTIWAT